MSDAPSATSRRPWPTPLVCVVVTALLLGSGAWLWGKIQDAREAARHSQCRSRLSGLRLAFHMYHDKYGCLPPAYVADADGKPMHSWRVLLLPFLDQQNVYDQYRFDEPWNSPHNGQLERLPYSPVFACPSSDPSEESTMANYVVIVGSETAFPGASSTKLADMTDGPGNTIMLVEIADSDIHWMEPRDLSFDKMTFRTNDPLLPGIGSVHPRGANIVLFEDGGMLRLDGSVRPQTVRALSTIAGGEPVTTDPPGLVDRRFGPPMGK